MGHKQTCGQPSQGRGEEPGSGPYPNSLPQLRWAQFGRSKLHHLCQQCIFEYSHAGCCTIPGGRGINSAAAALSSYMGQVSRSANPSPEFGLHPQGHFQKEHNPLLAGYQTSEHPIRGTARRTGCSPVAEALQGINCAFTFLRCGWGPRPDFSGSG